MINNIANRKTALALLFAIALTSALLLTFSASQVSAQTDGAGNPPPGGTPPNGALPSGAPPGGGMEAVSTNPVLTATCGVYLLDGESGDLSEAQTYTSTTGDESAICVMNEGDLTLVDATITKSGDSSSSDSSSFYGLNAAVLAGSGSTVTLSGGSVIADGAGANGVFATGEGSSVTLSDVTIEAVGDGAHGVMATLAGSMTLIDVDINTTGPHSGAIATDRGSGTITVSGGSVTTSGQDSPAIYSTGVITVSDATMTASGAEVAVIEGANSITLTDTSLSSSMEDKWGVMIYQSFSGDAEGTHGIFTMSGGSLAYTGNSGPLFFVTNSTGTITLKGVDVTATSGILVEAAANDRWGSSGSNGGTVIFTADEQTLTGNMVADRISTLNATLQNGSTLTGSINPDNTAKSVTLTLDETSTWNVTADSYLTYLTLSGSSITNIVGNGYTVYYDASACTALGGATYSLMDGGYLKPSA